MTAGAMSEQVKRKAERPAQPPKRAGKQTGRKLEELGPERRAELAQQIEAKRMRGKPPSI
jgi:hypothetical protein